MKILCLSDLHQRMTDVSDAIHQRCFTPFLQSIRDLVEDTARFHYENALSPAGNRAFENALIPVYPV